MKTKSLPALLVALGLSLSTLHALAQSAAFTYQGHLSDNGAPAQGSYDLRFALCDALTAGGTVGTPVTVAPVGVTNGLFTVTLDFGADVFDGSARWLEIGVRTNGSASAYAILAPRQAVTATPYAIQALTAGTATVTGPIADTQLSANIPRLTSNLVFSGAVTFNNPGSSFQGTFTGNGAGLANVDLRAVNSGGAILWSTNFTIGFTSASAFSVGNAPHSVAVGDVNGDGWRDLVSANYSDNTLTVLTNNGDGGFGTAATCGVGNSPNAVTLADVNKDGRLDLISANTTSSTLTVLTNNGGGFGLAATLGVGLGPRGVAATDVNGDGWVDLVSANTGGNSLTVLINNGQGGFVIARSPGVGNQPYAVVAAEVDGDGRADLVSANFQANTLTVLTNDGAGGFVTAATPAVGNRPYAVAAADFNGDGKVDLISADAVAGTLTVLTNSGQGNFVAAATNTIGGTPLSVTAADLNRDGWTDVISANNGASTLTVLTNNGQGLFVPASTNGVGAGPWSVVAADVNGDGGLDLISANATDNTLTVLLATPPAYQAAFTGSGAGLTSLNATNLSGILADTRLSSNVALLNSSPTFQGTVAASGFTGNGAGLTNLNLSTAGTWGITGNSGTTPGTEFLGTTDNQPLEFKVNGVRALRLEPNAVSPNFIGGYFDNRVSPGESGSTISGGGSQVINLFGIQQGPNTIDADFASIGGGDYNRIRTNADFSTIGGGNNNTIQDNASGSTIGGGIDNTIQSNASYATIPGGRDNSATNYAFAAGYRAKANHSGAFVWGDMSTFGDVASSAINEFTVRASGGVRFFSNSGVTAGVRLAPGDTAWSTLSDRNAKKNFQPVDTRTVLEQLAAVPVLCWNYKWERDDSVPHLGPVAQDFKAAFYPGRDDKTITTQEIDGVALAAIQGLNQKLEERLAEKDKQLASLHRQLAELQARERARESRLIALEKALRQDLDSIKQVSLQNGADDENTRIDD